jgi:hypothetical protein
MLAELWLLSVGMKVMVSPGAALTTSGSNIIAVPSEALFSIFTSWSAARAETGSARPMATAAAKNVFKIVPPVKTRTWSAPGLHFRVHAFQYSVSGSSGEKASETICRLIDDFGEKRVDFIPAGT